MAEDRNDAPFADFAADERCMRLAIAEAQKAGEKGDVPIGAVVVRDGQVIGRGHNQVEQLGDPTAHAEILAIGAACNSLGDWRLDGCALYSTLEPCTMCSGALMLARIGRLVYGARDPRAGAVRSVGRLLDSNPYNLEIEVVEGILEGECGDLLREFFRKLRLKEQEPPIGS